MSIYPRPNSPHLHIDFQIDNVRYAFSSGTASHAEALRIQTRAMAEARRRSAPSRGRKDMTFDEAAFRYWDDQGQFTKDADNLRGNMRRTVLMVGADTMCSWIDFDAMVGYRRELRQGLPEIDTTKGRKPAAQGVYKARTINKYLGLVFTVLNHAEGVLKTEFPDTPRPSERDEDDLPLLELVNPRSRYLKDEEERDLEGACKDEPDLLDMWKADLELGLRETNLCEARWDDYDRDARILTVSLKTKGKEPLPHEVYVTDKALEILSRREGKHPEFIFTLPCRINNWLDGEFRRKGDQIPVLPALLYSRMKEAWTKAKIKNLIIHDFRRTAARRVYLEKDIYAAKVFLGHRDIETTADYIGLGPVELADARRRMLRND